MFEQRNQWKLDADWIAQSVYNYRVSTFRGILGLEQGAKFERTASMQMEQHSVCNVRPAPFNPL